MVDNKFKIWLALIPAMTLPFAASLFYFVLLTDHWLAQWTYAATKMFTLAWPIVSVAFITRSGWPKVELSDNAHPRALPRGVVMGLGIVAVMCGLMFTPVGEMVMSSAPRIRDKAQSLGILKHYWAFGLFLAVIHSSIEEYYWRWFVFGHLRRVVWRRAAHLLAGASFAAHHVVVATQYFPLAWGLILGGLVGAGGILWSVMYEKQRTLTGAWMCHLIADLGILCIGHWLLFGTYF